MISPSDVLPDEILALKLKAEQQNGRLRRLRSYYRTRMEAPRVVAAYRAYAQALEKLRRALEKHVEDRCDKN